MLVQWAPTAGGWQHPEYVIASPGLNGSAPGLDQNGNPIQGSTPGMRPQGSSKKKPSNGSSPTGSTGSTNQKPKSGANIRATVFQPASAATPSAQPIQAQ